LCFLDETVQQHHFIVDDAEQHPANSSVRQAAPNFIEPVSQWTTHRHSNRPTELDSLDVMTCGAAISRRQFKQPVPNRFSAGGKFIEAGLNFLVLD
jgi:hypothetical protein